jgi:hypothetical protein
LERLVDLLVVGHAALPEGLDHAVETDLAAAGGGLALTTMNESRRVGALCGQHRRLCLL